MASYESIVNIARAALGLDEYAKLPMEGRQPVVINTGVMSWQVWIKPLTGTPTPRLGRWVHRRAGHRLMAHCLHCDQVMSAGRTHQHKCHKAQRKPRLSNVTRRLIIENALVNGHYPRPLGAVPVRDDA